MNITEKRIALGDELKQIIGNSRTYFEPPESVKLTYPCIVYKRSGGHTDYADNRLYRFKAKYIVSHIRKEPDGQLIEEMLGHFANSSYDRSFQVDNLYHDVYTLYY